MDQPTSICPLLTIANIGTEAGACACLEKGCAWWYYETLAPDVTHGQCLMQSIACSLSSLDMNGLTIIS